MAYLSIRSLLSESDWRDAGMKEKIIEIINDLSGSYPPHRFRRTGATFALSQGMPIIQVSKLLGHNDLNTTQIYLDISDEELMRGHEKYVT